MSRQNSKLKVIDSISDLNLNGQVLSLNTNGILGEANIDLKKGTGSSGNWPLDVNRVITYVVLRVKQQDGSYRLYQGDFDGHQPIKGSKKKIARIRNLTLAGITFKRPTEFNGKPGRGGVTYVEFPEAQPRKPREYREGSFTISMTRPDQSPFATEVRDNCYHRCVVTGASLRCITEAAHLTPHCDRGIPDISNGLLLRRDIHALFDHHEFAIEPDTLRFYFSKAAKECLHLADFSSRELTRDKMNSFINPEYLRERWEEFRCRHSHEFSCDAELEGAE